MNYLAKVFAILSLGFVSFFAHAGPFSCTSYGTAGCAKNIEDLVTDKFTSKYPKNKFEIVAVYEFQTYTDGGGVGYAVVGVVPKIKKSDQYGTLSLFPSNRFSATRRVTGHHVSPYQKTQYEVDMLRSAVESLMEACNRDRDCNVLSLR